MKENSIIYPYLQSLIRMLLIKETKSFGFQC